MSFIEKIIGFFSPKKEEQKKQPIYEEIETEEEFNNIWDFLELNENTQAAHISGILSFEEWITMQELRRRIFELFGVEYKNNRSLYPYLKTLFDCGLLEISNIGGKRKWRKKDLVIKLKKKKEKTLKLAVS